MSTSVGPLVVSVGHDSTDFDLPTAVLEAAGWIVWAVLEEDNEVLEISNEPGDETPTQIITVRWAPGVELLTRRSYEVAELKVVSPNVVGAVLIADGRKCSCTIEFPEERQEALLRAALEIARARILKHFRKECEEYEDWCSRFDYTSAVTVADDKAIDDEPDDDVSAPKPLDEALSNRLRAKGKRESQQVPELSHEGDRADVGTAIPFMTRAFAKFWDGVTALGFVDEFPWTLEWTHLDDESNGEGDKVHVLEVRVRERSVIFTLADNVGKHQCYLYLPPKLPVTTKRLIAVLARALAVNAASVRSERGLPREELTQDTQDAPPKVALVDKPGLATELRNEADENGHVDVAAIVSALIRVNGSSVTQSSAFRVAGLLTERGVLALEYAPSEQQDIARYLWSVQS